MLIERATIAGGLPVDQWGFKEYSPRHPSWDVCISLGSPCGKRRMDSEDLVLLELVDGLARVSIPHEFQARVYRTMLAWVHTFTDAMVRSGPVGAAGGRFLLLELSDRM